MPIPVDKRFREKEDIAMIKVFSVENMRKSDEYAALHTVPSRELMYRAGKGVFEAVDWREPVAIVCGGGNNAGDGYVIAKLLHEAGMRCEIILLSKRFSPDGAYFFAACLEAGVPVRYWARDVALSTFGTVVDCIFGTGFRNTVSGVEREAIDAINFSGAYTVSVDINSGLDGDSGRAEMCVLSDLTVSIGGFKTGHFLNSAKDVMKRKINCEIGIEPVEKPYYLITEEDLCPLFAPRRNDSHKGTYGYTALIGGSRKYVGALCLAEMANAAMRCGAGVVRLAFPDALYPAIAPRVLESTLFPLRDDGGEIVFEKEEADALIRGVRTAAFGMGVGRSGGARAFLTYLLGNYTGRLIVDADGLTLLSELEREKIHSAACALILTPHVKEFSGLTGKGIDEILNAPVAAAEEYARDHRVILLLKGPSTVVTDGETNYIVDAGCAGMATAGSGDVLSGILSAVLAYAPDPLLGTAAAAYINGKAGELAEKKSGSISMIASDTVACVRKVVRALEGKN